jgi:phage-related protein
VLGIEPDDWKPLSTVGAGVREIRIWDAAGAFRVIYIATLPKAIYVLHCFQKKTQKTPAREIDLARQRLKMILR